jgi:MFS family permease
LVEPIKADLHLSDTQMGMIVGFAFVLFYVLVGFPIARRVDRGSRKVIISVGVGLFAVMTMLCGMARSSGGCSLRVGLVWASAWHPRLLRCCLIFSKNWRARLCFKLRLCRWRRTFAGGRRLSSA